MFFNKIIMNPPYSTTGGGRIQLKVCSFSSTAVSLSPYYVNIVSYNYVKDIQKLNYKSEFDAHITNMCITTLSNEVQNKYTYKDIQFLGYNNNYIEFYKTNDSLKRTVKVKSNPPTWFFFEYIKENRDRFLITHARFTSTGFSKSGMMVDFYNGKDVNFIANTRPKETKGNTFEFVNKQARDNFFVFLSKGSLENKLLFGLNKLGGNPDLAVPRINWEQISDTELWEQGKYDEAVLSVMGLKLKDEKIVHIN